MITLRRIYLYTVLAVLLVPVLVGMGDLLEVLFDRLAEASGKRAVVRFDETRGDLSLALALLIVATPLWGLHAWLLRRSTHGSPDATRDERASPVRSSYFLVVLLVTLIVASVALIAWVDMALRSNPMDGPFEPSTALAYGISFGVAWAIHAWWRMRDLRLAPERTAGDWLTRVDLYAVLFVAGIAALISFSDLITTMARLVIDGRAITSTTDWLRDAVAGPMAAILVMTAVWLLHWLGGRRLCLAPDPLGGAHRSSRMRAAYFVGIALVSSAAVLLLISESLRQVLLDVADVRWRGADPDRLEVIGGPLLASVPFLVAWWWHLRRVAYEASMVGADALRVTVTRIGRLAIAIVGLTGLALGSAQVIGAILDLGSTYADAGIVPASIVRRELSGAVSMTIVGLAIWLPSWILVQRERAHGGVAVASSMARRGYLVLVSGVAMVAAMISGAWVVYQAIGALLESGRAEDVSGAIGVLIVASVGLGYHLIVVRSDLRLAPVANATDVMPPATQAVPMAGPAQHTVEKLEISGPIDADFTALNAALRERLPEGFELRIIETHEA
jgi:hypothetical protein